MRLKELRKEAGLTQKQFAKEIGAAQNTVSQWEAGTRRLDDETIKRIASFFGVSVDYLLGLSESKRVSLADNVSEAKQAMYNLIDELPDDKVLKLYDLAKAALEL